MTYKSSPYYPKPPIAVSPDNDGVVPSIPGVIMPEVSKYDNVVDSELHTELYNYLTNQVWHQMWSAIPGELQYFKPSDWDTSWINATSIKRTVNQPRCLFGSDEEYIKNNHPPVWRLWNKINELLDNKYELTGTPENMWADDKPNIPSDPSLSAGWRVYANASMHDLIQLGGYVHRDTKDLNDDSTVTMLWVANTEWYPSWGGEVQFYPEDPEGLSQDHQQFNATEHKQQRRGFQVGWVDEGKTISLRPNRLIVYDGRTLHSTTPTKHRYDSTPSRRVVFRARKKK